MCVCVVCVCVHVCVCVICTSAAMYVCSCLNELCTFFACLGQSESKYACTIKGEKFQGCLMGVSWETMNYSIPHRRPLWPPDV